MKKVSVRIPSTSESGRPVKVVGSKTETNPELMRRFYVKTADKYKFIVGTFNQLSNYLAEGKHIILGNELKKR
jgi:hypothetical protein